MQNSKMYNDIRTGNFDFKAFVDPNDPTKVYAQQNKMWEIYLINYVIYIFKKFEILIKIIKSIIFKLKYFEMPLLFQVVNLIIYYFIQ